jgi:hypothetical protein
MQIGRLITKITLDGDAAAEFRQILIARAFDTDRFEDNRLCGSIETPSQIWSYSGELCQTK